MANEKKTDYKPGEQEWLIIFCRELLKTRYYDYLVFGHRHFPIDIPLNAESHYINLGEWIDFRTFAVYDGTNVELKTFNPEKK